jgi:hypothetical protein
MSVPVIGIGESFVNAVIEILVVREENMTADIVELMLKSVRHSTKQKQSKGSRHTKPSAVTSVEARPPGVSLESSISHEGPSYKQ